MFANHGALKKHNHEIERINSRIDGLQAAILSVKLKYIHEWTDLRIQHAASYTTFLSGVENIVTPLTHEDAKHVFHLYVIRLDKRDGLQEILKDNGISTGCHYPTALPYLNAYEYLEHLPDDFPVAYKYPRQILSLPMYAELESNTIKRISKIVSDFSLDRLTYLK